MSPPSPQALRLLRLLAARAGQFVPRRELWRDLWADEHTRDGRLARGTNPDVLDRRLRLLVLELRRALGTLGSQVASAVENRRGDEDEGGYRLALPPDQVQVA